MMNLEHAAMKGRLAELKERKAGLEMRAEGLCESLRTLLNTALIPLDELEINRAIQHMDDLSSCMVEIYAIDGKMQRLQRELG